MTLPKPYTRRAFLGQTAAMAATGLAAQIPAKRLWALTPADLLPEPDEALMRKLAHVAMDTARAGGASFADIRLAIGGTLVLGSATNGGQPPTLDWPYWMLTAGFNVRTMVDGAWGWSGHQVLSPDAAAETARLAVELARANRPRRPRTLELAPAPRVEDGRWETPIERDPFSVPLGEQTELFRAALGEVASNPKVTNASVGVEWRRPTTLFASTEGTLLIQRICTAIPHGSVNVSVGTDTWSEAEGRVGGFRLGGYGYEALGAAGLKAEVGQAAERATELARAARAPTSVEVGRYDLVFGHGAVRSLLVELSGALNLELALGYHANGAGSTFAAPPGDMLGKVAIASPRITVRGDRSRPGGAANVAWDEEGVKPEPYTFIEDGVVVDYHNTRQTAVEIGGWYRGKGRPVRSQGCTRHTGMSEAGIILPNLTLDPGPGDTTVDDLIAGTKRGFYIESAGGSTDQQVLSAQYSTRHQAVRQISNGKLGGYIKDLAFQFVTPQLWKSVDGIGGAASARSDTMVIDMGAMMDPLQPFPFATLSTVPLRVRQVNVLNVGRTA